MIYEYFCHKCNSEFVQNKKMSEGYTDITCTHCGNNSDVDDVNISKQIRTVPNLAELQINANVHMKHNPNSPMVKRSVEYTNSDGKTRVKDLTHSRNYASEGQRKNQKSK